MPLRFEEAVDLQHTYLPEDDETIRVLSSVTLAPLVGPTAAGKNHAMKLLSSRFGYHQVGNTISRELRDNDPSNVKHMRLAAILELIDRGELVQFAALLGSRALYATTIEDYRPNTVNLKDIFAHSLPQFMNYGFRSVKPVCLLTPPEEWETRLDQRFQTLPAEQRAARLSEAAGSLTWMMSGSPGIQRVLVIANDSYVEENLERIRCFVEENEDVPPEQIHFDIAEQMLEEIPRLYQKYVKEEEL